jgi:hypothetical protein
MILIAGGLIPMCPDRDVGASFDTVPGFATMGRMRDDIVIDGPWVKSSLSFANGNCVECATFRKASASASNGHCLEAASCSHGVAVRDTKLASSPVLVFGSEGWRRFTAAVKSGTVAH